MHKQGHNLHTACCGHSLLIRYLAIDLNNPAMYGCVYILRSPIAGFIGRYDRSMAPCWMPPDLYKYDPLCLHISFLDGYVPELQQRMFCRRL